MPDTKLIVIDGLPGSGKTTAAEWLTRQLQQRGVAVQFLPESDTAHPLWWYDYWDGMEYHPPDFDNIPIETFIETSLVKWKDFAASLKESNRRYVAESIFFQNAVGTFLMGGAAPVRLSEYAREVQRIARDLDPILIYFRQGDAAGALRKICAIRGRDFEHELLANMERFPYLKRGDLKGLDGVTALWRDIQALTDKLFDEYAIRKLALETSKGDWMYYRQQTLEFLGL